MKDSPTATTLFFSEAEINLTRAGFSVERAVSKQLVTSAMENHMYLLRT